MAQLVQPWIDRIYADQHGGLSETNLASYFFHDLYNEWPEKAKTAWQGAWSALPESQRTGDNAKRVTEMVLKQIQDETNSEASKYNYDLGPRDLEKIIGPAREAIKEEEDKRVEERYGTHPAQHNRPVPGTNTFETSPDEMLTPASAAEAPAAEAPAPAVAPEAAPAPEAEAPAPVAAAPASEAAPAPEAEAPEASGAAAPAGDSAAAAVAAPAAAPVTTGTPSWDSLMDPSHVPGGASPVAPAAEAPASEAAPAEAAQEAAPAEAGPVDSSGIGYENEQ
jgi:hypothetical protein